MLRAYLKKTRRYGANIGVKHGNPHPYQHTSVLARSVLDIKSGIMPTFSAEMVMHHQDKDKDQVLAHEV